VLLDVALVVLHRGGREILCGVPAVDVLAEGDPGAGAHLGLSVVRGLLSLALGAEPADRAAVILDGAVLARRLGRRLLRQRADGELFAVAADGGVYGAWWHGQWSDWYRIGTQEFVPRSPVIASARSADYFDLWAIGVDGRPYWAWWHGEWHDWTPVGTAIFT
jgi:hypothetical protein